MTSLTSLRRLTPSTLSLKRFLSHPKSSNCTLHCISARFLSQSQPEVNSNSASSNADQHQIDEYYDIIIAGGGLNGTICGVALATSPILASKRILLLEASPSFASSTLQKSSTNFSNRVFAINPGSKRFLEKINIWNSLQRFNEVYSMQVWDALSTSSIQLNNPGFSEPVSYIVENPILSSAVEESLSQSPNVTVQFGCSLKNCKLPTGDNPSSDAQAELSNGKRVSSSLIIGADGYNSKVRLCMGSPYVGGVYDRTAIVATLQLSPETQTESNNVAWQRFLPTGGPIALLPLSRDYSSLVWSTYPSNAKRLLALSEEDFVDEVNSALTHEYSKSALVTKSAEFLSAIGKSINVSRGPGLLLPPLISSVAPKSRASFPLGFGHAAYYVHSRAALIGDAAHRVHPLGGLGLNLGIGDVACLLGVLEDCASVGEGLGSFERLKRYETERQKHNLFIQGGLEFMHRMYGTNIAPVVMARSVGLSLVNANEALKKCIMAQASA